MPALSRRPDTPSCSPSRTTLGFSSRAWRSASILHSRSSSPLPDCDGAYETLLRFPVALLLILLGALSGGVHDMAARLDCPFDGGEQIVNVEGLGHRSEERRVGKECRSRWWRADWK